MAPSVYVISLAEATARRQSIAAQLDSVRIPFQFVDAVRGSLLSPEDIASYQTNQRAGAGWQRDITPGEIGCILSHVRAYEKMRADGAKWGIFLEDDVSLTPLFHEFRKSFQDGYTLDAKSLYLLGGQDDLESRELVQLSLHGKVYWSGNNSLSKSIASARYLWRTCAYLIHRSTAENIENLNRGCAAVADNWHFFQKTGAFQNIFLSTPPLVVHPPLEANSSTLEGDRLASRGRSLRTPAQEFRREVKKILRQGLRLLP